MNRNHVEMIATCLLVLSFTFGCSHLGVKPVSSNADRILVIGQDNDSINAYVAAMGADGTPSGVSAYVDMELNGLTADTFNGSGINNIARLAKTYPSAALVVAVKAQNQLDQIILGHWDANIDKLFKTLLSYKRQIFLRFGYEFDGPWNQYEPDKYIASWKHLFRRLEALEGHGRIAMVWHSSSQCHHGGIRSFNGHPLNAWYPGDEFVDFVAISYFTPGGFTDRQVQGGTCIIPNEAIDKVAQFARLHGKALMIAEAAPQGYSIKDLSWRHRYGGALNPQVSVSVTEIINWYDRYFDWVNTNKVKVLTYINTDWNSQAMYTFPATTDYWGSSRIQDNVTIKAMWLERLVSENLIARPSQTNNN